MTIRERGLKKAERQAIALARRLETTSPAEADGFRLLARKLRRTRRRVGRTTARPCAA